MINRSQFKIIKIIKIIALLINCFTGFTQTLTNVRQSIYKDSSRLVEIYKDIHQNPELAFLEERTSSIVATELMRLGYKVITGVGKTGVVGILENGKGPVVMYRADMDCNAVKETTNLTYASNKTMKKEDGAEVPVMHACGHDAHVTWMLGIAKQMKEFRNSWSGTMIFIAQPAEEVIKGAKAMIDDGLYTKGVPVPDYLLGMHAWPISVGTIDNGTGVRFAGSDQLDVTFYGVGGHGASPELTTDPIVMGANAILQYQTIISRNIAALDAAVLTVGSFISGTTNNIIPSNATLKLNLRWFNDKVRSTLLDRINLINEGIAKANKVPYELYPTVNIKSSVTPLINEAKMQSRVNGALTKIMPPTSIISNNPPVMVSEDFHNLIPEGSKIPYDYIFVGVANKILVEAAQKEGKLYPYYNHNGNFIVDLAAIPWGTLVGVTALIELFSK